MLRQKLTPGRPIFSSIGNDAALKGFRVHIGRSPIGLFSKHPILILILPMLLLDTGLGHMSKHGVNTRACHMCVFASLKENEDVDGGQSRVAYIESLELDLAGH